MLQLSKEDNERFNEIIGKYLQSDEIKKLDEYIAHGKVSVLKHSINVAKQAYLLNKQLKLNADEETLLVGALLHDFYLYDWHNKPLNINIFKMHGYTHPKTACDNAIKIFNVNEDIQEVIRSHMWPLTLRSLPKNKEAFIVCMADKLCAIKETIYDR